MKLQLLVFLGSNLGPGFSNNAACLSLDPIEQDAVAGSTAGCNELRLRVRAVGEDYDLSGCGVVGAG